MKLDDDFLEWLSHIDILNDTRDGLLKKSLYTWWGTIKEKVPNLKRTSDKHLQYISVFLEYYSRWLDTLQEDEREKKIQIIPLLEQINKKIYNQNQKRNKVVGEWFNHETGFFEYELDDGTWIQSDKKAHKNLYGPDIVEQTFGKLYKRLINPHLFRDEVIEKIFN